MELLRARFNFCGIPCLTFSLVSQFESRLSRNNTVVAQSQRAGFPFCVSEMAEQRESRQKASNHL